MTEHVQSLDARDRTLAGLLEYPHGRVVALAPDARRVPVPAALGLGDDRLVPVPEGGANMLELLHPDDVVPALTTWERVARTGVASLDARLHDEPDRHYKVTAIDMRHRYGVFVCVLVPLDDDGSVSGTSIEQSLASLRPRSGRMLKKFDGVITEIDDRVTRMLGWTRQQMIGSRSTHFFHEEDVHRSIAGWLDMLGTRQGSRSRVRHRCADGGWLWIEIENIYPQAAELADAVIVSHISDISEEMAAYEALGQREHLFRRLADSLPIGLLQLGQDGSVVYANSLLAAMLGTGAARTAQEQLASVADRDRMMLDTALEHVLRGGPDRELEVAVEPVAARGEPRRCTMTLIGLSDEEGAPGALICVRDITESVRSREELRIRATFDHLTGCHNRASSLAILDRELSVQDHRRTGVIFIDLNEFKSVNDSLGHAAGDELLVQAANRIRGVLRGDDVVGRIGGDEFLLICPRLDLPAEVTAIAERVAEALEGEVVLPGGTARLSAAIGVTCSMPGSTGDALIAQADTAMYASKRRRSRRPVPFDEAFTGAETEAGAGAGAGMGMGAGTPSPPPPGAVRT
ncbi:sensor domain-containing diguanylate cyclase [Planomonospora sp. ID82291]|uniref:sensor domain-containing diguanylate cyclase n=1 Tax=Planomonospora sp. ID82291 TaxID=2738136 RepID=UPI0018C4496E|nr:sensor domain-containing diguanylate cyclase [Planomonospora sp. ID82291]MBG0816690.1 sensor domain-containing diguanylate cyclase [Planomonospora sp. ID82291]